MWGLAYLFTKESVKPLPLGGGYKDVLDFVSSSDKISPLATLSLRSFIPSGLSLRWREVREFSELSLSGMKGCTWESPSFRSVEDVNF